MQDSRLPKLAFALLVLSALVYFSWLYPQLPEVIQSHFNANGQPNGWQPKSVFFEFIAGITVLAAVVGFGVPQIIKAVPAELINLPNTQYWLAPDRAAETLEFFSASFAWFGCALYVMLLFACNYALESTLHPDRRLDPSAMWIPLVLFGAFVIIWGIRMTLRFARTSQ